MVNGERSIVLVTHDVRSAHNAGSILRTADGLGVDKVYLTGYTPYPAHPDDERLPHIQRKVTAQIHKTALGAEDSVSWEQHADIHQLINKLRADGFLIAALEQTKSTQSLPEFRQRGKIAVIVGSEVQGLPHNVLSTCDISLEIPMLGAKESLNVAVAAAIALYHLKFFA